MSSIDCLSAVIGRPWAIMPTRLLRAIVAGALGITVVGCVAALRGVVVGEPLVALSAALWGAVVGVPLRTMTVGLRGVVVAELLGTMTVDGRRTGAVGLWGRPVVGLLGRSILGRARVPIRSRGSRCWMLGCCLRRCVVGGQRLSR